MQGASTWQPGEVTSRVKFFPETRADAALRGASFVPFTATLAKVGGQRVATIVMYLAEPEKGGATTFPDVSLEVAPKRGNGVFFSYDRPHPVTRTLHGGAPVLAGEKWIATKWLRERRFE